MLLSGGIKGWCVCMYVDGVGVAENLQAGGGGPFFGSSPPLFCVTALRLEKKESTV